MSTSCQLHVVLEGVMFHVRVRLIYLPLIQWQFNFVTALNGNIIMFNRLFSAKCSCYSNLAEFNSVTVTEITMELNKVDEAFSLKAHGNLLTYLKEGRFFCTCPIKLSYPAHLYRTCPFSKLSGLAFRSQGDAGMHQSWGENRAEYCTILCVSPRLNVHTHRKTSEPHSEAKFSASLLNLTLHLHGPLSSTFSPTQLLLFSGCSVHSFRSEGADSLPLTAIKGKLSR